MISMLVIYSAWALVGHTNSLDSFREEDINWEENIYNADGIEDIMELMILMAFKELLT